MWDLWSFVKLRYWKYWCISRNCHAKNKEYVSTTLVQRHCNELQNSHIHQVLRKRYIYEITVSKYRHALAIIITGNSNLEVVTGRHGDIDMWLCMLCMLCKIQKVEDKFHYILECEYYTDIRNRFIHPKYYVNPNFHKLSMLMNKSSKSGIVNLLMYCFHALNKRTNAAIRQNCQPDMSGAMFAI